MPKTLFRAIANPIEPPGENKAAESPKELPDLLGQLRQAAARLLGVAAASLDPARPLTALGLDSITAVELQHEIELRSGTSLPFAFLLEGASLEQLTAAALDRKVVPLAPPAPAGSIVGSAGVAGQPLSYEQRSLWFLDRLAPGSAAYHVAAAARVDGLDVLRLRVAFEILVERHPGLRTTFHAVDGEPLQEVHARLDLPFAVEDATGWDEARLVVRLRDEAERGFDLDRGPLLRVALFTLSPGRHAVLLVVHHLVCDFWSLAVVARELGKLYSLGREGAALLPLPVRSYGDHVTRQRSLLASQRGETLWAYWRSQLGGALPDLDLPTDRPRPSVQTYAGGSHLFALGARTGPAIRALARAQGATYFMTLLAAFLALLSRLTGQERVQVGSPTAGRSSADLAGVVGDFANPVVLCGDLSGDCDFGELLDRVRQTTLGAFAHQEYPFALLAERLQPARDLSRSPLFQAAFVLYQDPPSVPAGLAALALGVPDVRVTTGALTFEAIPVRPRAAQFDLTLAAADLGSGPAGCWLYNSDLFDAVRVVRLAGHFRALLESALARPDLRLSELPLLAAAERHQLTLEWNDSRVEGYEGTLQGLCTAQARRSPRADAVVYEGDRLTYAELDRRANRLAHYLGARGVGPETLVAIAVERSLAMIWALLGILKAGAAYVPLDPSYPGERLAFMLDDCQAPVLLTVRSLVATLPPYRGLLVCLDEPGLLENESEEDPGIAVGPGNLAYAIYTSGSTGNPKAALNTQGGIVNRLLWMQEAYRLTAADRVLQKTPISFDVSVWELFWPLLAGARLVICRPGGHRDSAYLARLIARERVTTAHFVPSMLEVFLEDPAVAGCGCLERVICSGEALPAAVEQRFFSRLAARLHNLYGPTEAAVDVTYWACERGGGRRSVPIGRPIANTAIHLLDPDLRPVPVGVPGELHISGAGLARGYLGRPGLTAEKFIPHPVADVPGAVLYRTGDLARFLADGAIEFLGRLDHQVKLRGFRVEPGEIESALCDHPAVKSAVVLLREGSLGDRRLVAYVVLAGAAGTAGIPGPILAELRRHLAERLPEHMVPAGFVPLAELPLSANGKLDRRALPELGDGALQIPGRGCFRTPFEEIVAGVLARVLGRERVGVGKDFFALGGHSLLALRALSALGVMVGRELPVTALFQHPTAASLAASLEALLATSEGPAAPAIRPTGGRVARPLSFAQQRLWFLDQLEPGSPLYNCPLAVRLTGNLDLRALERSLAEICARHEVLRTVFPGAGGVPIPVTRPALHPSLPLIDLAALRPARREAESARLSAEEAGRVFDLACGPLVRGAVLRIGPQRHLGLLTFHHIVCDEWSLGVLVRELGAFYSGFAAGRPVALPELPVQYADFALWQQEQLRSDVVAGHLSYWRRQLAGAPARLELPLDRQPRQPSHRGAMHRFELSPDLCRGLEEVGRRDGATLFMTLLAAFQVLLYRSSGQDDVVVGADLANRGRPEIEDLIGFFINLVPLRGDLAGNPPFRELLQRVRQAVLGAYLHQGPAVRQAGGGSAAGAHPRPDPPGARRLLFPAHRARAARPPRARSGAARARWEVGEARPDAVHRAATGGDVRELGVPHRAVRRRHHRPSLRSIRGTARASRGKPGRAPGLFRPRARGRAVAARYRETGAQGCEARSSAGPGSGRRSWAGRSPAMKGESPWKK